MGKRDLIVKTEAAVKDYLTKGITYWNRRAEELKLKEQTGKLNAGLCGAGDRGQQYRLKAKIGKAGMARRHTPNQSRCILCLLSVGPLTKISRFVSGAENGSPARTFVRQALSSLAGLEQAGILVSKAGKVRLLKTAERSVDRDPSAEKRLTVWVLG
jgi:hypothetical protein